MLFALWLLTMGVTYAPAPQNVVVLYLKTADCDTGATLYEKREEMPEFGNAIEFCRTDGVRRAKELTAIYRAHGHPNASTNVTCTWEQGIPLAPA